MSHFIAKIQSGAPWHLTPCPFFPYRQSQPPQIQKDPPEIQPYGHAAVSGVTALTDRIDLVDKNNTRRCFCASLKRSRTRDAPTPTNISTKSEPASEKNGTSPLRQRLLQAASYRFPAVHKKRSLRKLRSNITVYFAGLCKKSTTSCSDSFASSCPATSRKGHARLTSPHKPSRCSCRHPLRRRCPGT